MCGLGVPNKNEWFDEVHGCRICCTIVAILWDGSLRLEISCDFVCFFASCLAWSRMEGCISTRTKLIEIVANWKWMIFEFKSQSWIVIKLARIRARGDVLHDSCLPQSGGTVLPLSLAVCPSNQNNKLVDEDKSTLNSLDNEAVSSPYPSSHSTQYRERTEWQERDY